MMRNKLHRIGIFVGILVGFIALMPIVPVAAASCSNTGCNGKDPYATSCQDSRSYTVYYRDMTFSGHPNNWPFELTARVELRYSPTCGTNWAKAKIIRYSTSNAPYMEVELRYSNGTTIKGADWTTNYHVVGWEVYGDMFYAPNTPVMACVRLGYAGELSSWSCTAAG